MQYEDGGGEREETFLMAIWSSLFADPDMCYHAIIYPIARYCNICWIYSFVEIVVDGVTSLAI
jgi:hypothetical protein